MVATSDRAEALRRTFVASFLALDDLRKSSPADAIEIESALVSHVRAAFPMRLLDTGPVVKMTPEEIEADISEIDKLRTEVAAMRSVYVAAIAWRDTEICGRELCEAINAAVPKESP